MTQGVGRHGGVGVGQAEDWVRGLVRAVWREAIPPRDARVKSLWDLLRQRQLLARSPWLRRVLRHTWDRGLAARVRPYTGRRMARVLRRWGILPPWIGAAGATSMSVSVQPGAAARLIPLRQVIAPGFRPRPIVVRPVIVRPAARPGGRR